MDSELAFVFDAADLVVLLADPTAEPQVGTGDYNGTVKILGADAVTGPWGEIKDGNKPVFFKATMTK